MSELFMDGLKTLPNASGVTDNGAAAFETTCDDVVDFFGSIGAMREWNKNNKIDLFRRAYFQDKETTLKTLFYGRDVRGGLGERQTFIDLFHELVKMDFDTSINVVGYISEFGRWKDFLDIFYKLVEENDENKKPLITKMAAIIKEQVTKDYDTIKYNNKMAEFNRVITSNTDNYIQDWIGEPLIIKAKWGVPIKYDDINTEEFEIEISADEVCKKLNVDTVIKDFSFQFGVDDKTEYLVIIKEIVLIDEIRQYIKENGTVFPITTKLIHKSRPISLIGKFLPTIGRYCNTKTDILRSPLVLGMRQETYRKMIAQFKKYLDLVERHICHVEYGKIDYNKVPSYAMKRYKTLFYKNDAERFIEYIEGLKTGKTKVNSSVLFPYDVVESYFYPERNIMNTYEPNPLFEAQWKDLPDYMGDKPLNGLVVCDTSYSMVMNSNAKPFYTSLAMTIYISERNANPIFKDKYIQFSRNAHFKSISHCDTLYSKLRSFSDDSTSTNIENVFDLLLTNCVRNKLGQKDLPEFLLFVSDLQFDCDRYDVQYPNELSMANSLMDNIAAKWKNYNYDLPKCIWWNVNSKPGSFPMTIMHNAWFVSGHSPAALKCILSGEYDITALDIVKKAVYIDRYNMITTVSE